MNTTHNKQIFIIDDDPFWTNALAFLLNELNYNNIATFQSGEECIQNLPLKPELIFLDYEMGEMDGLKTLQKIKSVMGDVNVVFATSKEDLEVAMNAMKLGSSDYLLKQNSSIEDLHEVLSKLKNKNNQFN